MTRTKSHTPPTYAQSIVHEFRAYHRTPLRLSQTILGQQNCEMCRFARQNGTFHTLKRVVSHCKTTCFVNHWISNTYTAHGILLPKKVPLLAENDILKETISAFQITFNRRHNQFGMQCQSPVTALHRQSITTICLRKRMDSTMLRATWCGFISNG